MGFFGFVFWIVVVWMVIKYWHRREGRRMSGRRGYTPTSGWYDSGEFYNPKRRAAETTGQELVADQQQYIEALESRVNELEERLDFTERLLATRREPITG